MLHYSSMIEHCVYSRDPHFPSVIAWLDSRGIDLEFHLNRTRFWLDPTSPLYTEFLLRWADYCPTVE